jgi:PqqD family protein of HPr-rel-A system
MTSPAGGTTRWWVRSVAPFAWAHSDSGHVLYHRHSGQTHFLNEGCALLLRECLPEPRDAAEAALALAKLQGAEPDPQFLRHVAELLQHLERVGLIESVAM